MNTIYIARAERISGDSFDVLVTFDREAAIAAAKNDRAGMTERERGKTIHSVSAYRTSVETVDAWNKEVNKLICLPDPVEYTEI